MSCFRHFSVFLVVAVVVVVVEEVGGGSWYFAYRSGICNGGGGAGKKTPNIGAGGFQKLQGKKSKSIIDPLLSLYINCGPSLNSKKYTR